MLIRSARPDDAPGLAAIYGHHVMHGTGSFELEPPDADEMARRLAAIEAGGWPWIVAQQPEGALLGFAYASQLRPRMAFRFAVEDSVYVAPEAVGQGVGRLLLAELIARCQARGARQMVAVIGDSANAASIGLHAALGFAHAGAVQAVGWKFDRWLDVVYMQRRLGAGADTEPVDDR